MKKLFLFLVTIIAILGCQQNEIKKEPVINYSGGTDISVSKDGGSFDIAFSTNNEWTISSSESWITINPSKGNPGDIRVIANASANPNYDSRSTIITISSGGIQTNIKVQQPTNEDFVLQETKFSIGSDGGDIKIPVRANIDYTCKVAESCKNWLTIKQTKSLQDYQIVVSIAKNDSNDTRTGTFEVSYGSHTETVTITQSQLGEFIVGQTEFEIGSDGGEIFVPVYANIEYQAQVLGAALNWIIITKVQTKGLEEYFMILQISENSGFDGRVGQVKVYGAGKESVITINQSQTTGLEIAETFEVGYEEQSFDISYKSNVDVTCEIEKSAQSWLSVVKTKGLVKGSITLHAKKNDSNTERVAKIKIIADEIEKEVSVKQAKNSDIIVFADNHAKAVCVLYFDTNGDGEISMQEAAAVTQIPEGVFSKRAILTFNEFQYFTNIKELPKGCFQDCIELQNIQLPDGLSSIGNEAFSNCSSLTSITIPEGVSDIGEGAFESCSSLKSISIPKGVSTIAKRTFFGCSGLKSITIPNSVTTIEDCNALGPDGAYGAFSNCTNLTSIDIPESMTYIGTCAFSGCSGLKSISIPKGVTTIAAGTFHECTGLTSITIPEGVTAIKGDNFFYGAFAACTNLTSIDIPESMTYIGQYAFFGCSGLTSITIPEGVTTIEDCAFNGCTRLTSITIPESVTTIEAWAFTACTNLTSIDIPESMTYIGQYAFFGCSGLTSITIPEGVTTIARGTFEGCTGLASITIPEGVSFIGMYAFSGCTGLTSITIPESVTYIDYEAFSNCRNLESIFCKPITPPQIGSSTFSTNASNTKIYVPLGSVEEYKEASNWRNYASQIVGYEF